MKNSANLLFVAALALMLGFARQATAQSQLDGSNTLPRLSQNRALLRSPRYLEEHPELLRSRAGTESRVFEPERPAKPTANIALANSPRYREEHPELRWAKLPAKPAVSANEGLAKLMENKALAASPRFREEHPGLLRGEPALEIAPLK